MSEVPPRVRRFIYLYYAGIVIGALGLIGFVVSFGQVGSAAQAAIDVHETAPVLAYASIAAWLVGLATMWFAKRTLDAAVREKMSQNRIAALAGEDQSGPAGEGE
jgi:uncharacterized membrane protein